jgi:hypothetical protein
MTSTNVTDYPLLNAYSVIAAGEFLVPPAASTIQINDGNWGSIYNFPNGPISSTTGAEVGGSAQTLALGQLNTFIGAIQGAAPTTPIPIGTTTTFVPGYYTGTNISYSNKTLTFNAGGDPNAKFFIVDSGDSLFTNCVFNLIGDTQTFNIILLASNITASDSSLTGVIIGINNVYVTVTIASTSPVIFNGKIYQNGVVDATTRYLILRNLSSTVSLTIESSGAQVCYAAGTKILTKKGYVAIEDIQIGDSIVTHGSIKNGSITNTKTTFKPAIWTSSFTVSATNTITTPIRIKKGALAQGAPFEDLYVSPNHGVTVGNRLVLACTLVNGTTIVQEYPERAVTYYHIELPSHSTIIANGVLAESYLDDNNRYRFTKRNTPRLAHV